MQKKKILAGILVAAMAMATLAGCGAGIEQAPTSFSEIAHASEKLKAAGCTELIANSVYDWWFEQFLNKQGLEMVDNGNGRDAAAT